MVFRKWGALFLAATLLLSVASTAFAQTVPQAVYGESRPTTVVQKILQTAGVKDVPTTHWAAGSISVLVESGLITPNVQGNLNPDSAMTATSGVAVFAKVLGIASKTDSPAEAAAKAEQAGLIEVKAGSLKRLDVAVMLFKALGLQPAPVTSASQVGFADAGKVSSEYWGILAALKQAGVFKGFPDGTFGVDGELTAAQLALLVDRILGAN